MKRKRKWINTVLACGPVVLLLACGAAETVRLDGRSGRDGFFEEETAGSATGGQDYGQESAYGQELAGGQKAESAAGGRETAGQRETAETALVYICGEVLWPGVYEVAADARICDVLLLAGGFTERAAGEEVNLAQRVSDGMQVVIPSVEESREGRRDEERREAGMVNINTASLAELCSLPGIGESRAADIIAYREKAGGFRAAEEIMQVSGIKEAVYEKLKDKIYIE